MNTKIIGLLLFFLTSPLYAKEPEVFSRTQILMGNIPVSIEIRTEKSQARTFLAMQQAFDRARALEQKMSWYIPDSEISVLNKTAAKKTGHISPELARVIKQAQMASQKTKGRFDITFRSKDKNISYRDLDFNWAKRTLRYKKENTVIDVSGLAKGFIVDEMSRVLRQKGFAQHLVNAGGDLLARGVWEVSVRHPSSGLACSLTIKNRGLSTSGLYERGHHIINATTKNAITSLGSSTILSKNSFESDTWDTVAFILGEKLVPSFFAKLNDKKLDWLLIKNSGQALSSGFFMDKCPF